MRRFLEVVILIFTLSVFLSCKKQESLANMPLFKQLNWKKESVSCREIDTNTLLQIEKNKEIFFGKNEKEISDALNTPNKTDLYTRGQKFFLYYINCDSVGTPENSLRLRFNAIGYVNEVLLLGTI